MRILKILTLLVFVCFTTSAQVATLFFEKNDAFEQFPVLNQINRKGLSVIKLPQISEEKLLVEDKDKRMDKPFQFGYGIDVNYTLNDGKWEEVNDKRIWSLCISSPGAYSLNFIFSEMFLPAEAELYVYNTDGSMVYGPVTSEQNPKEGPFLTDMIKGDEVIIQLIEPISSKEKSRLSISRVVHGYIDMFSSEKEIGLKAAQLSCHNNVICYPEWQTESDAVALVLSSSGTSMFSGALVNNTSQNFTPFFLTAFHCADSVRNHILSDEELSNIRSWVFRFQYKTTSCNGSSTGSYISYNGAYFRAGWDDSDFLLVELRNKITQSNISFLGWDRTGNITSSSVGIHHPGGAPMKISFDNNPNTIRSNNRFLRVGFDSGGGEPGSSGSPLLDENKRVIGQLNGGPNTSGLCPPDAEVYYGRFFSSWNGNNTPETQLSYWLNGSGSTITSINTIKNVVISGPELIPCSGTATYSIPHSYPVTWNVVSSGLQLVSGQNTNTITVRAISNPGGSSGGFIQAIVTLPGEVTTAVQKTVFIGAPQVVSVTGPSSARVGGSVYFHAAPMFSEGDYEWRVEPSSTATQSPWRHTNYITFNAPGSYTVLCRSTSPCTSPGSFAYAGINVSGYSYMVSTGISNIITISKLNTSENQSVNTPDETIPYSLYSPSGILVSQGKLPDNGGTLDFSNVPGGVYLLQLIGKNNTTETHRVLLK